MPQTFVTTGIDSQAIGVLKVRCASEALRRNFAVGYTAKQIHREHFFLPRLIIRSSDIHAAGCFTLENIAKRTRMLEYTGERITKAEGDLRYEGRPFTYLFGVGDGEVVIDGHGMAMFVNHSCDPNCETDEEGGTGLHRRHSRHCRRRRTYLRLLPLRWRRRGALFLRQQKLPGKHVLSRRTEENGAGRSPQEETGRDRRRRRTAPGEK